MNNVTGNTPPGGHIYSSDYFILRGMYQEMCANGQQDDIIPIMQAIKERHQSGFISKREYDELVHMVSSRGKVERSEEFERLHRVILKLLEKNGTIPEDSAKEIEEEINLAASHGLLRGGEDSILRAALTSTMPAIRVIKPVIRANDVPSRKKARAKSSVQTPGCKELFQDYQALYTTESVQNWESTRRKFFRKVASYYQNGLITVKEYRDFHAALDDHSAYLDEITIDTRSRAFEGFRERLLGIMSTDGEVVEVIKQIADWSVRKRGVSAEAVMANIVGIADKNLDSFINSGMMLITVAAREAVVIPMRQMQLS